MIELQEYMYPVYDELDKVNLGHKRFSKEELENLNADIKVGIIDGKGTFHDIHGRLVCHDEVGARLQQLNLVKDFYVRVGFFGESLATVCSVESVDEKNSGHFQMTREMLNALYNVIQSISPEKSFEQNYDYFCWGDILSNPKARQEILYKVTGQNETEVQSTGSQKNAMTNFTRSIQCGKHLKQKLHGD